MSVENYQSEVDDEHFDVSADSYETSENLLMDTTHRGGEQIAGGRSCELLGQIPEGFSEAARTQLTREIMRNPENVSVNDAGQFVVRAPGKNAGIQVYMQNGDSLTLGADGRLQGVSGIFKISQNDGIAKYSHPATESGLSIPTGAPHQGEAWRGSGRGPLMPRLKSSGPVRNG